MFDVKNLLEAAQSLSAVTNIQNEKIHEITIHCLERAYISLLTGPKPPKDMPEPRVRIAVDFEKGKVAFYQIKTIRKDVEDDMLEIDLEDAQDLVTGKKKAELKYDEDIEIRDDNIDPDELSNLFVRQFKYNFHQRLNDAEQVVLYDTYKDRIGEIILGTVEKVEEKAVTVNVGKNKAILYRRGMIGDETFQVGQQIKLYLADNSSDKTGNKRIEVTRSHPGFVKRLFEEEIHEIYDGTIVIKDIARRAGKRSKVAVYSNDSNVDATGSCIGKDGTRINKIVSQLGGNGRDKEKIDIVAYSDNIALYIVDALRPAEVIGINIDKDDETGKEATCIVKDNQYSKAIGLRGINITLAQELTGFDLTILEETATKEEGLKYTTVEELRAKEAERLEEIKKAKFAKQSMEYKEQKEAALKEAELKKVEANRLASIEENKKKISAKSTKINVSTVRASSLEEELAKAKASAARAEKREAEHVEIKTTTNILDLEKQLEAQKEEAKKPVKKTSRHPRKITEEEVPNEVKETPVIKDEIKKMDIYTEEELRAMEEEEKDANLDNVDDEDIDYDEYDEYYDDEK